MEGRICTQTNLLLALHKLALVRYPLISSLLLIRNKNLQIDSAPFSLHRMASASIPALGVTQSLSLVGINKPKRERTKQRKRRESQPKADKSDPIVPPQVEKNGIDRPMEAKGTEKKRKVITSKKKKIIHLNKKLFSHLSIHFPF